MRKIVKVLSGFITTATVAVLGMIVFGTNTIPNEFYLAESSSINVNRPFSFEIVSQDKQAASLVERGETPQEYEVSIKLLKKIPVKSTKVTVTQRRYVVPSGKVFGLRLYTDGVVIVGTDDVKTQNGAENPAKNAGLKQGDIIIAIDGKKVTRNSQVSKALESCNGNEITMNILRSGNAMEIKFKPLLSATDSRYKAGLWVRDSSAGIGTMTYFNRDTGVFGGLGHAVCDIDTGDKMPLLEGDIIQSSINGCYKGSSGNPGELRGVFGNKVIGSLLINGPTGVFGYLNSSINDEKEVPVAMKHEVKLGYAQIMATIQGDTTDYYDIEIVKINSTSDSYQKNMIVKITDRALIDKTGGIVQGMSGSPIIQNGMLVGAVTHVFVNDPQQGYAIFAENMMNTSDYVEQKNHKNAS